MTVGRFAKIALVVGVLYLAAWLATIYNATVEFPKMVDIMVVVGGLFMTAFWLITTVVVAVIWAWADRRRRRKRPPDPPRRS